jgi:hypothetical protein
LVLSSGANRLVSLVVIGSGVFIFSDAGKVTFSINFSIFDIEDISLCKINLLFRFTNIMEKDTQNNNSAGDNSINEQKSDINKDIKKRMDRYEEKIKSTEAPAGDATRSDE